MALKTFEYKFIAFLHATSVDQDGIDNLMRHQQHVLDRISEAPRLVDVLDREYLLSTVTSHKESTGDMH